MGLVDNDTPNNENGLDWRDGGRQHAGASGLINIEYMHGLLLKQLRPPRLRGMATGFAAWTNQFGLGLSLKKGYPRMAEMQAGFCSGFR
jgi:hypothetical protein